MSSEEREIREEIGLFRLLKPKWFLAQQLFWSFSSQYLSAHSLCQAFFGRSFSFSGKMKNPVRVGAGLASVPGFQLLWPSSAD